MPHSELRWTDGGPKGARPRRPAARRRPSHVAPGTTWVEATGIGREPAAVPPIARNGRPRNAITMPGHRRGCKPANTGKRYPPEPLSETEVLRLLAVIPQNTRCGVRDRALVTVLWRTGLRVSEALALKPHEIDTPARRITVARGKGDKRRVVAIDDYGLAGLQPWLFERAGLDGMPATAPLFCTIQLPGRGNRMYPAYVRVKLHQYGEAARITKRVHPHGLRHTIACDLIREKFSLTEVQTVLGHTSPATTAIYLRGLGAGDTFEKHAARRAPGSSAS